ncbi:MAG: FkbM family methyltransferase [Polymorphobacter sp.]
MELSTELDSPARHRRSKKAILSALFRKQNYLAVYHAFRYCEKPVDFLQRYVSNGGSYPAQVRLRSPVGMLDVTTYSSDDIQTINEIFFRGDYEATTANRMIVDFGSNIGISALYFLSRNREARVYCYEPVPRNVERLKKNLAAFNDRYTVTETAVGESDGTVQFGWEPTGRYGGVGRETGTWISVPCRDSNAILSDIIAEHGRIDLLKIDIETLEKIVTERITPEIAAHITAMVVEYPFAANPLAQTHDMERRNYVTAFTARR